MCHFKNVLIILPQTKMLQRHLIKRCFYSRQLIRVCSFLFITYFLHNNIQEDWLLYKKNTFNSAHTKQSATSEITTTKKNRQGKV